MTRPRACFALFLVIAAAAAIVPAAAAERDHLKCYKIRDRHENEKLEVTLDNQFGRGLCTVRTKAKLACLQTAKGGGDDPRGAQPGDFLCYRLKCRNKCKKGNVCNPDTGRCEPNGVPCEATPPDVPVDDQFNNVDPRVIKFGKAHYLCAPATRVICGDGVLNAGEECDLPPADGACPGQCRADCTCPTVRFPGLDHFSVYEAEDGPDGPSVSLSDEFQTQSVDLGETIYFLPPVSKNGEGIFDPVTHLTCYGIAEGTFSASVDVANQFGAQTLQVSNPRALCVPSEVDPPAMSPPAVLRRDHYRCYEATGDPLALPVTLTDAPSGAEVLEVGAPFLFCNPADKNGEGIVRLNDHLTCYEVTRTPPETPLDEPVDFRNQFHQETLTVQQRTGLCVPSVKIDVQP